MAAAGKAALGLPVLRKRASQPLRTAGVAAGSITHRYRPLFLTRRILWSPPVWWSLNSCRY